MLVCRLFNGDISTAEIIYRQMRWEFLMYGKLEMIMEDDPFVYL